MFNSNKTPLYVNFYELERYDDSSFRSNCPVCHSGLLTMIRCSDTGQLLQQDNCVLCGQLFIYNDIDLVRKKHGRS